MRARTRLPASLAPVLLLAGVGAAALFGLGSPATAAAPAAAPTAAPAGAPAANLLARGELLYSLDCQTCHEASGAGQPAEGIPSLHGVGAAAVEFYLSTGRMPEATLERQAPRKPVSIDPADQSALVAFVTTTWPGGPPIPTFSLQGNIQNGGDLFRTNCSACHGAVGAGAALANGAYAPSLHKANALQVAEAVRVGPGNMPVFEPATLSDSEVADIVTYVEYLHHPDDRGGAGLGYTGPIAEGFVGLLIGLGGAVAIASWAGHRTDDEPIPHHG
jgi:ubiquinol-cytochrome c reductase cytochrome c subunit